MLHHASRRDSAEHQPPLKPLRLVYARYVLEEIVPSFQALSEDRCLDDQIGTFGTDAPDFGVGATRGRVGGLV
jgi:hypothetical protein